MEVIWIWRITSLMMRTFDDCLTLYEFALTKEQVCKSLLKIQFGGLTIK